MVDHRAGRWFCFGGAWLMAGLRESASRPRSRRWHGRLFSFAPRRSRRG